MSILVNPHNEKEEKALIAFLNSMKYDYKPDIGTDEEVMQAFIDQYNKEIDEAEAEIEAGDYLDQDQVEKLFADRRKSLMRIKWNKTAIRQLFDAIEFIEETGFPAYAEELEKDILSRIRDLPQNPIIYPLDKYRKINDGSYHAFEVDNYRVSYRYKKHEIRIVRIRHTSRRTRKY